MTDQPLNVAYLAVTYARASDTFIRSEVIELRRRGHAVQTFSIRLADDAQFIDEEVRQEKANTDYVLEHHPVRLFWSVFKMAVRRPAGALKAVKLALKARQPGLRSTIWHAAYFVEAAYLAEQLSDRACDVLHIHTPESACTAGMLAAAWADIPFTMTVHGPAIFDAPIHWSLPLKLRQAAGVACITHFCRSQCMAWSDVADWSKFAIVRCGLNDAFLESEPIPVPDNPRFVCVGRLVPEKGQALLIEAAGRLKAEGVRCELLFVGDGPNRSVIEQLIAQYDLHDQVTLAGWANGDQIRQHVLDSRAMCMPSFAEGLPVSIMEALALQRPVISTYIAGHPELLETGKTGWLVPAGAIEPLMHAMRAAVEAPTADLTAMGAEGRQRVLQQHDIHKNVDDLLALFHASTPQPHAPRPKLEATAEASVG